MIKLKNRGKNNIYLYQTGVDNMFINDLLPMAPGDYVKVYMFGLMYSEQGKEVRQSQMAGILGMPEDKIDEAWTYWEKQGVVEIEKTGDSEEEANYNVKFISQIEAYFNANANANGNLHSDGKKAEEAISDDRNILNKDMALVLKKLYEELEEKSGQLLSPKAMDTVAEAIGTYQVNPKVFSYAIKYCTDRNQYSVDYITKVAINWKKEGLESKSEVLDYNAEYDERYSNYKRIFEKMGFRRPVSDADIELMDPWFDKYNFTLKEVLDACGKTAGLREPNLKYVNKVLMNEYERRGGDSTDPDSKKVSRKVLEKYLQALREYEISQFNSRYKEVQSKIPVWKEVERLEREIKESILTFNFTAEAKEKREINRKRQKELEKKKKKILISNGYPEDYLDIWYKCDKCNDSGVTSSGQICSCIEDRTKEAYVWNQKRLKK